MKITTNFIKQTKRHFSASGSILLPLALKWSLVAFMASVILAVLVTPCLAPHMAAAASITLTIPDNPLALTLTPTPEGTFNSTAASVTIKTDALAGYTLSIKAKSAADLTNATATGAENVIKSIGSTATISENDFKTLSTYNNKWGFAFGKGGESKTFHGLNDKDSVKIGDSSVPNRSEDTYSITLGARINNMIATGTYSNTFIIEASANPVPYKVTYNENSTTGGVSNMPSNVASTTTSTQTFAISSQEPSRTGGYEFIGWCDQKPDQENNVDVCQTGAYQASDEYTLSQRDQTVTFYAMWVDNSHIMQNWKGCETAELNKQITLVDIRDNREYYVAKLADGNCWMTENLDFFIDKNTTYTVADTDLDHATEEEIAACEESVPSCKDENGKYQWKPVAGTHETGDHKWDNTAIAGSPGLTQPQSYDPGDACWKGERTWTVGKDLASESVKCEPHDSSHYHIGNYYNYTAAVAQNDTTNHVTRTVPLNSSTGSSDLDTPYDTSICPAGWQLPNLEGERSFNNLQDKIKSDTASQNWAAGYIAGNQTTGQEKIQESTIHKSPYFLPYTGFRNGEPLSDFSSRGLYHYNDAATSDIVTYYFTNNAKDGVITIYTGGGHRYTGMSVRCVSRE